MSLVLSQQEVDVLPKGTEVWVTWAGGNGPHRYTIIGAGLHDHNRVDNPYHDMLYPVGAHPLTTVRVASNTESRSE